jgi:hypothetical protein
MDYSHLSQHSSVRTHPLTRRARLLTALATLVALTSLAALTAAPASAITDAEELARFGSLGTGAGQLIVPDGIATDPTTGHVVVADSNNNRIDEFTPWGDFVKAFGWDVAPGAVNEQQEVRVRAAAGQFKLTFKASSTPDLAFNAPGAESEGPGSVEAALNALPSIGGAGASVSVTASPGTSDGVIPTVYVIVFKGSLAATNADQITAASGTTALSGGKPSTTLEARTRADGTPGGTGLESCTAESGCKAGLAGVGAGQFRGINKRVALDAAGDVYVTESAENHRVQKFDSSGRFLLMFGGEVNETTKENRCTAASGDACGIGAVGSEPGEFGPNTSGAGIAFSPTGKLFVADAERIQRFNSEGEFEASIPVSGVTVRDLAIDPGSGALYITTGFQNVRKLSSTTGAEIGVLEGTELDGSPGTKATAGPVATDPAGNVFALRNNVSPSPVLQFDSAGKQTSEFGMAETGYRIFAIGANAIGDVYVAYFRPSPGENFIRSFGPGPASFEAPPLVSPEIVGQFASSVGRTDATVAAEINPHFWTDTRYYVEYGTGKCSEGGCDAQKPLSPGEILTSKVSGRPLRSAGVFLEGLKAGTTYHYRFVAQSSGGGPVTGEEHSLVTYPAAKPAKADCPNRVFRTGFSAPLSDCRAYEMVSPVDKNNGDIKTLYNFTTTTLTSVSQSSIDGGKFTYSSYRGFANPKGAPYTNQYLAARKDGVGWLSESLNAAQSSHLVNKSTFENHFKAFSPDLCLGWQIVAAEPILAPGAYENPYGELYRGDYCGKDGYEALIGVEPTPPTDYNVILQGTSASGREAVFTANKKLTEGAAGDGLWQTYYTANGELHLICIGPGGAPTATNCSAGSGPRSERTDLTELEREGSVSHAISDDASKVYWTDSGGKESGTGKKGGTGTGKVYLRLNPGQEQSAIEGGECSEAEKACTIKVSETVTSKASRFIGASVDGTKALFEVTEGAQKDNLYLFDLQEDDSRLIAGEASGAGFADSRDTATGLVGASEDLSRIYFSSEEALPETSGATAGGPNLYLDEEGTKTFIATLADGDGENTHPMPIYHTARATPDGRALAFVSSRSLTGYDNADLVNGKANLEVYRYEVGAPGPVCVSCNPSRARPVGRSLALPSTNHIPPAGSSLSRPENDLYAPRVISADGKRLFFNSYDALVLRDTNGKADVYEWESASGQKECEGMGAELYVQAASGCISLISSGQSPSDSEFLDASEDGDDAFFTTGASLLPQDPGLIDVYDARSGGGLPAPPAPPGPCQGEACQFGAPPPNDPTPASASFKGAGNLKPPSRCAKGKVARKGRCVARKPKQAKKHKRTRKANHNRGAGR